jgi:hypothetical protein
LPLILPDSRDHNPEPPVSILNLGASNSPSQNHQLLAQGEKLQREFGSAHKQATNENEHHLAETHLASAHEVFLSEEYGEKSS